MLAITGTYWEIGRRIVECEQDGEDRAEYGKRIVELLSNDLTKRFGRGFSSRNLWYMKDFFLSWKILQTPSAESHFALNESKTLGLADQNSQTLPAKLDLSQRAASDGNEHAVPTPIASTLPGV